VVVGLLKIEKNEEFRKNLLILFKFFDLAERK